MSFPWEAYAISQSLQDEICKDASDEAKDSIRRLAPPQNPTSAERRIYNENTDFARVQAEQLCRGASPKIQKLNIDALPNIALGILASLTQTVGDSNRFADMCREFLDNKDATCDQADLEEFDNECRAFLEERMGQCTEGDVVDFLDECDKFITPKVSYCGQVKTDSLLNKFAGECKVFFDAKFPECADVEEETNLVQQYTDMCKEFIDEGRDFCLDLLHDAQGVVVDVEKKVVDIGIDAAWKIPYAALREVALIAVKVVDRIAWRRIQAEAKKRQMKIGKVHDELVQLCMPDKLIQKGRSGSIQATVKSMVGKILSACIGDFF